MAGGVVEGAAAGYQAQRGEVGRAINDVGGESGFGVLADARDPEHGRDPVGELHVNGVAPAQRAEAEEDSRPPLAVHVSLDDRRPDLAGRRRVLVPRRLAGVRPDGGDLDRAVGVEPEVQQGRIHADGRDVHRDRKRASQRRPAGRGAGDPRLRRPGLRRVHLGADRDAHGDGAGQDEHDPGDPGQPGTRARRGGGRRGVPRLRPGDDHAEPGNTPPRRVRQCRRPFLSASTPLA